MNSHWAYDHLPLYFFLGSFSIFLFVLPLFLKQSRKKAVKNRLLLLEKVNQEILFKRSEETQSAVIIPIYAMYTRKSRHKTSYLHVYKHIRPLSLSVSLCLSSDIQEINLAQLNVNKYARKWEKK